MMSWLGTLASRDEGGDALGRHAALLGSLTLLLVALPLVQSVAGATLSFRLLLSVVLLAAIYVNSRQRWIFTAAAIVGGGAIVVLIYASLSASSSTGPRIVGDALSLGLLGFTTLVMVNSLIQAERVSSDTVVGGICVYLLVGLCFAMTYILIAEAAPGSFVMGTDPLIVTAENGDPSSSRLLYFSFVTITTLGYGDITPMSDFAQMLAVAEALIGQLYLTIFVARLVALFVSESTRA